MNKEIISNLISQHGFLKKSLGKIKNESVKDSPDFTFIFGRLKKFKKNITEHVEFENRELYNKLFEKYRDNEKDLESIKKFQVEMDVLAGEVREFIDKFTYKQKIEKRFEEFKNELDFIISSLQIRITSEEEGVFIL